MKKKNKQFPSQSIQKEKLIGIGSHLHQVRTQQGISLEEVGQKTQIPLRLLAAIEDGNLAILPEAIYIRGLIHKFAQALGEDGLSLSQSFPLEALTKLRPRQLGWIKLNQSQLRPVHLYLLYIVMVVGAVNSLSAILQKSITSIEPRHEASVAIVSSVDNSEPKSVQQVVQPDNPSEPVVIEVTLKDQSWLQVVVDGQVQFEGTLPEGSQRTWIANEKLTLRTGNAGGVIVTLNDQKEQRLGIPGQVQEVTYIARHNRS
jgi:cytoskeletal protein RodZ